MTPCPGCTQLRQAEKQLDPEEAKRGYRFGLRRRPKSPASP
jgi:hypothetical protein